MPSTTPLATRNLAAAISVPDLLVSSITTPISVVQGAALSFSYVALNQGGANSGAHYAGISFDAQPTATSFLGYNYVGALGTNASQTLTNTISTVGLSIGTHTLYIKADFYGNAVAEGDETNNVKSVTFTVTAPVVASASDLVVSSISAPTSVVQGSAFSFSYVALNQGGANAGAHYAGISFDAQPTATSFLGYNYVGALVTNASQTLTNTISTVGLSIGTHTLYIKEDFYGNAVAEGNEANNVKSVTFTVTAPVAASASDLVVSSISAPTSVVQGAALSFSYVALNQGGANAGAHYAGISFDAQPTATSFLGYNYVGALGTNASQTLTNTISTVGLSIGTHTLYIKEDFYGNLIAEGNEANNVKSVTFTVTAPANKAPVLITPLLDQSWTEGTARQYTVPAATFTDPDGNALTYSATLSTGAALPSWLVFYPSIATFYGAAPAGSPDYVVRVKATDTGGLSTFDDVAFTTAAPTSVGASGFNITLTYTGDQAYATYFSQAKAIWERVITGDLPDFAGVDDLAISASVAYIDGPSNILAQAGPTNFRAGALGLPYKGTMKFDSADMAKMVTNGSLVAVITHEMGHVLGFGSGWDWLGLNANFGQYTGAAALAEYRALSGNPNAQFVPLETGGGAGTANSHWRETVFETELMTGYSEGSGNMPLSRMSIAAMQDLGYSVNYAAADSYTLPQAALMGTPDVSGVADVLLII